MFKTLALAAAVLIAGVLLYAATRPDHFTVQRRITIAAPPEKIFPLVNDLHAFATWSPYEKKDPAMKHTHGGAASGPGATYTWDGNDQVGQGSMTITDAAAPSKVTIKLDFVRPFEAHNTVDFTLAPASAAAGNATQVTWAMHGPSPYMSKLMGLVFDMDTMVGKDFEDGLASLKAAAEK